MTQKRSTADRAPAAKSRAQDSREMDERQDMDYYAPPSRLTVPTDDGGEYHYRWIAEYVNGDYRAVNVQKQLQDGYRRVTMESLPEDFLLYDPTDKRSEDDGFTRYGGLILMKMPMKRYKARQAYYQRQSQQRVNSANELQGIAGRDAVEEDRGSRTLQGEDAARALQNMSQS